MSATHGAVELNRNLFFQLPEREQEKLYRDANIKADCKAVEAMNEWGMHQKFPLYGPAIISGYMDVATQRGIINDKLKQLQQQGRLLEHHQFEVTNAWIKKSQLGRILGRDYLEEKIQLLALKYMKVPNKIAVFKEAANSSKLVIKLFQGVHFDETESDQLDIYAERIKPIDRKLTNEEVEELFKLLAASGYADITSENFIIAADGLYFIDTEFSAFAEEPDWSKLKRLASKVESPEFLQQLITTKTESATLPSCELKNSHYGMIKRIIQIYEKACKDGGIESEELEILQQARELEALYKRVGADVRLTVFNPTELIF